MKRIIFLLFFIFTLSKIGLCDGEIYFNFDYAVFQDENGKSILEIYYSVNQQSLIYIKTENNFEAAAKIDLSITEISKNEIMFSNVYKTPSVVTDTSNKKINQKIVGQVNYSLPAGNYKLQITGTDFNDSTKKDIYEKVILIGSREPDKIEISDIELSTLIRKSENNKSIFYKNTLEVIPNPSDLYGMNLRELFYYLEIYGLIPENISDEFDLNYKVTNLNNEPLISYTKRIKRNSEAKADYGKIKIDSLKRGAYILQVSVTDSSKNVNTIREKRFFVFNSIGEAPSTTDQNEFLKSEYATMTSKQIEDEFDKMIYIIPQENITRFKSLNSLNDKRKFLYSFWKAKDSNPEKPILKAKEDYFKRIDQANKLFKEAYTPGWKTDRGRIYIVYGKPDDIDNHQFQSGTKSYEIWTYNSIEGGGECDFIELQPMTGVYWLVNSTFRRELRNNEWESQLTHN